MEDKSDVILRESLDRMRDTVRACSSSSEDIDLDDVLDHIKRLYEVDKAASDMLVGIFVYRIGRFVNQSMADMANAAYEAAKQGNEDAAWPEIRKILEATGMDFIRETISSIEKLLE